jgi:hypothetical protein
MKCVGHSQGSGNSRLQVSPPVATYGHRSIEHANEMEDNVGEGAREPLNLDHPFPPLLTCKLLPFSFMLSAGQSRRLNCYWSDQGSQLLTWLAKCNANKSSRSPLFSFCVMNSSHIANKGYWRTSGLRAQYVATCQPLADSPIGQSPYADNTEVSDYL